MSSAKFSEPFCSPLFIFKDGFSLKDTHHLLSASLALCWGAIECQNSSVTPSLFILLYRVRPSSRLRSFRDPARNIPLYSNSRVSNKNGWGNPALKMDDVFSGIRFDSKFRTKYEWAVAASKVKFMAIGKISRQDVITWTQPLRHFARFWNRVASCVKNSESLR